MNSEPEISIDELCDRLDDLDPSVIGENWAQDAAALIAIFADVLKESKLPSKDVAKVSLKLLSRAAEYGGGRNWYLPTKGKVIQGLRDKLIYLDSRKISVRDLVSKYGLSEPHIYRVIKSQQKIQCSRKI